MFLQMKLNVRNAGDNYGDLSSSMAVCTENSRKRTKKGADRIKLIHLIIRGARRNHSKALRELALYR